MPTQPLTAAIAVTRFGYGGQPGEIDAASRDPAGFLTAQIRPEGADQVAGTDDSTAQRMALYFEYARRKRELKNERRAAYAVEKKASPQDSGKTAMITGPVNRKGKPLYSSEGERLIRPKRDAGLDRLQTLVVGDLTARIKLAATTPAAFRERWTQFWINHFAVGNKKPQHAMLNAPYERDAIRPHVFGRFDDMAFAVAHHPTMLLFLSQTKSVGPNSEVGKVQKEGLNENLARETLELHTMGAESGYTQADVTEFARALTGFTIARRNRSDATPGGFYFDPAAHEPGARTILGRRFDQPGEAQANAVLRMAANDPRTAAHLAHKLAVHFVADDPPPGLVKALQQAWLDSRGNLATVARALVAAPDAWAPAPAKFKAPYEYLVSCYRAGGMSADELSLAFATLERFGQRPFSPPSPKGWPEEGSAWATSAGLMDRLQFANARAGELAAGHQPSALATSALGARVSPSLATAMQRAHSPTEALTILFMSPEFQRR